MSTITDINNRAHAMWALEAEINEAYQAGRTVTVEGREVRSLGRTPASSFQNGTLAIEVQSLRQAGKTQTLWFKEDRPLPVVEIA